jgi:uncharacterized coiled-coil DUF342 family protein
MADSHKKMSEIRKETDAFGPKLEQIIEMISQIIKDYGKIKHEITEYETRYTETANGG